jgi:PAS domain S-box-containing protein
MIQSDPRDSLLRHEDELALQSTMRQMAALVGSEWVSAFDYDFAAGEAFRTIRWAHPALKQDPDHVLRVPLRLVPEWDVEAHRRGEPIWFADTSALPDGLIRQLYIKEGIQSVLALPMMEQGECRGFVQFTWQKKVAAYTSTETALLGLLAGMLVTMLHSRRAERQKQESEQRLRGLTNNLDDGMVYQVVVGPGGSRTFTFLSESVRHLYGITPQQGMADASLIYGCLHPDDLPTLVAAEEAAAAELRPFKAEARMRCPEGQYRWSSFSSKPTLLPDGRTSWDGIEYVITDHKQAEQQRERLLLAVEHAAEAIVITDTRGAIEYVNPAFTRVTGYSREEALGQNPRILKSGTMDPAVYRELWAALAAGSTWQGRLVNRKKDGSHYTEEATISPVIGEDGRASHYVAVKHDITERLRLEAQFLQSQKMETVGRLAGGIAHDFNNMMGVIFSVAEMELEDVSPGQPLHLSLTRILRAAQRSSDLTAQLLAFARKQPVSPKALDLNAQVGGLLDMVRRLIGEQVSLHWAPGQGLGWVRMDPVQVDQVLVNLCVNARDALDGVGELRLSTQAVTLTPEFCAGREGLKPGPHALLTVSDNGCGMEPATLARAFEPFFSTKALGKGSGLGLSTVYGIVQQNGGTVDADSTPGHGATFRVYLPLAAQGPVKGPAAAQPQAARTALGILLVEDEPALLELAQLSLQRLGHRVLAANSPQDALRLAQAHAGEIQLLLTDVIMPGMNGRELAEALQPMIPGLKCLYMSGYTADIIAKHGVLEDGLQFLQKPFTQATLAAKLAAVL